MSWWHDGRGRDDAVNDCDQPNLANRHGWTDDELGQMRDRIWWEKAMREMGRDQEKDDALKAVAVWLGALVMGVSLWLLW